MSQKVFPVGNSPLVEIRREEAKLLQDLDELFGCGRKLDVFGGSCRFLHHDFANQSNAFSTLANRQVGPCSSNGPHDQHAAELLVE